MSHRGRSGWYAKHGAVEPLAAERRRWLRLWRRRRRLTLGRRRLRFGGTELSQAHLLHLLLMTGTGDGFMKSFDPNAASARLIALRKSKAASLSGHAPEVGGGDEQRTLAEGRHCGAEGHEHINRAAMLELLSSIAITHLARCTDMRKSLEFEGVYDPLIKLGPP